MNSELDQLDGLAHSFLWFAEQQFREASPLYERLCRAIADDPDILALAAHARNRPAVLLFLGAVHSLVLHSPRHPLARYYPSVTPVPAAGDPYPAFRAFL